MEILVLSITILLEVVLVGSVTLTIIFNNIRIWPPPSRYSWQYWFTWIVTSLVVAGILANGILDWGSMGFNFWTWKVLGVTLMIAGIVLSLWAVKTLTVKTTTGLVGKFTIDGPYQFTRNPQYVGDIILTVGFILASGSWLALVTGFLGALWFVLAPLAEEPWLQELYGKQYERYLTEVPRFIGVPKKVSRRSK
jgi:protein-S-isoprenylcysteine O-methyltransferase Ste14